jgi:nucleoside-diphosphate-sugar epimerase
MHLLITGANGFIGRALARRLLSESAPLPGCNEAIDRLTLIDLGFEGDEVPRVRRVAGSIADSTVLARAFDTTVDVVFHLASIPGGMAEQNYELGRQVNIDATLHLLEAARAQALCGSRVATFVFASSIAVFGAPLPALVDDATPPRPSLSYGAHKLIGEILLEDFNRRGWIQGRALRLPGIVARPPQRTGQLSAFMSDLIRELAAGRSYACPVSADSTLWLMSVPCVVRNLLRAATLHERDCAHRHVWTLPALHASLTELVGAVAKAFDNDAPKRVSFGSNPALEANFGRYPPLHTPAAEAAGFVHDGDLPTLVRRALEPVL